MSERQKQTVFLKRMLQLEESHQQRELQQRIAQAERDEKCVCAAMHLVGVVGLLCLCGICYEAVFVEDFFTNPTHLLTRLFSYLGLGSTLCWVIFMGYWLWHRALTNRLYEEGRRLLVNKEGSAGNLVTLTDGSDSQPASVSKEDSDEDTTRLLPKAA